MSNFVFYLHFLLLLFYFHFLYFSFAFLLPWALALLWRRLPHLVMLPPAEPRVHIRLIALIKNTTCNTSWKLVHNCVDVRKLLWEWDLNEKWRKCFTRENICSSYQKRNLKGPFPQFSSQKELRPKFNSTNWKRLKIEYRASSELLRSSFPDAQSQNGF